MPRPKGLAKTGGRQKGTKNKTPELRALISEALDKAGGVDYLVRQANENPGPFLQLLGRLVPREIQAEISGELTVRAEIRRELIDRLVILMAPSTAQDATRATIDCAMDAVAGLPHLPSGDDPVTLRDRKRERASLTHAIGDAAPQSSFDLT